MRRAEGATCEDVRRAVDARLGKGGHPVDAELRAQRLEEVDAVIRESSLFAFKEAIEVPADLVLECIPADARCEMLSNETNELLVRNAMPYRAVLVIA